MENVTSLTPDFLKLRCMLKRCSCCGRTAPTHPRDEGTWRGAVVSAALICVINTHRNSEGVLWRFILYIETWGSTFFKLQKWKQNKISLLTTCGITSCVIGQQTRPRLLNLGKWGKLGITLLRLELLVPKEAPCLIAGVAKAVWVWRSPSVICFSPYHESHK